MRWKISHRGHDPRNLDLLAVTLLLIAVIFACRYIADTTATPPSNTAFIVPSQTVRW